MALTPNQALAMYRRNLEDTIAKLERYLDAQLSVGHRQIRIPNEYIKGIAEAMTLYRGAGWNIACSTQPDGVYLRFE